MTLPKTMHAAILYGQKDVRIETRPVPEPGPGEVVLAVEAALTDGTDLKVYRRGYHAKMIQPPAPFGHEFAGTIVALGPDVLGWKVGDRVVGANSAPCNGCHFCLAGQDNLCDRIVFVNGAYAPYLLLPRQLVEHNLLPIPDKLDAASAALTEPLACVVKGIREMNLDQRDSIAVIGSGPIGLMAVRLASREAVDVALLGRRKDQLKLGKKLGATEVHLIRTEEEVGPILRNFNGEHGPEKIFEATGLPAVWEEAIACVRRGGIVNLFGGCPAGTRVSFDTNRLHYDDITLKSSFHHTRRDIRAALDLIVKGELKPHRLFDGEEPLDQLPRVLDEMDRRVRTLKTVIRPFTVASNSPEPRPAE